MVIISGALRSVQCRPCFCVIDAEYSILTQDAIIVGSYLCKFHFRATCLQVVFVFYVISRDWKVPFLHEKRMANETEKHEDGLDKDGKA